jgi:hypothetical protein
MGVALIMMVIGKRDIAPIMTVITAKGGCADHSGDHGKWALRLS